MSSKPRFRGLLAAAVLGASSLLIGCDVDKQSGRTNTGGTAASNPGPAGVGSPGGAEGATGTTGVTGSTSSAGTTGTPGTGSSGVSK